MSCQFLDQARGLRIDAAHALHLAEAAAVDHPRVAAGLRMLAVNFHGQAQELEIQSQLYSGPATSINCDGILRGNADLVAA